MIFFLLLLPLDLLLEWSLLLRNTKFSLVSSVVFKVDLDRATPPPQQMSLCKMGCKATLTKQSNSALLQDPEWMEEKCPWFSPPWSFFSDRGGL